MPYFKIRIRARIELIAEGADEAACRAKVDEIAARRGEGMTLHIEEAIPGIRVYVEKAFPDPPSEDVEVTPYP